MRGKDNIHFVLWGVVCTTLIFGCSTKKNSSATRAYHEFTTRYNIYFNAEEAYNETLKSIMESRIDNYHDLLPMYPNSSVLNDTVVKQPGGPFDKVVEKMARAIQEHSITVKPRRDPSQPNTQQYRDWLRQSEFNPFIDRAWLLMGKAHVQNKDYTEAVSVLSQTVRLFNYDIDVVSEAQIWMMRAYAEMGWFLDAENLAATLQVRSLPKNLRNEFNEFYAFLLLRKKDYRDAVPFLIQTIGNEKSKIRKRRLQFLLGQIYTDLGERENAYKAFGQIKGLSTPYEETFNALMAQSQVTTGGREIIGELQKMANNKKNEEYLDQIHAAIGNAYLSQNNIEKAIENYLLAEKKSVRNGVEKALAQVALGDIYFDRKEFIKAEPRYSGALSTLPRSNKDYLRIEFRANVLGELVPHIAAVAAQDSLQHLPASPGTLKASGKIIEEGLFNIGNIAKDRLEDFDFAVKAYNRHLADFPESIQRKDVYYQLYLIYLRTGDRMMAQNFKNRIVLEFPASEYTAAMADPDYEYVVRNYARVQDSLYQQTYRAYQQGQAKRVQENFEQAQKLFSNGNLMPKFMLLNALSLAQSGNREQLEAALQGLAQKYPDTKETAMAQHILTGLSEGKALAANASAIPKLDWVREAVVADTVSFNARKDLPHSYLLLFPSDSIRKNDLLFAVSDFNFSNFRLRIFNTAYIRVAPYEALQIRPFRSFDEAGRYAAMIAADSIFRQQITSGIVPLVISDDNLEFLQAGKSISEYMAFYSDSIRMIVPIKGPEIMAETEKTVPLEPEKNDGPAVILQQQTPKQLERLTVEQRRAELERKAEEALKQTGNVLSKRDRERILKEREQSRKELVKQRERELKQREKARKEELKRRERERRQKMKEQKRLHK